MAQITGHKSTIFFNMVLTLFFVLVVCGVESRVVGSVPAAGPGLVCNKVVGVESGDTCFTIAQNFGLSLEDFRFINPDLKCRALFVGQWLCISGKST